MTGFVRSTALIEFYAGRAPDSRGRRIEDIWAMSFEELEYTHDYIQWLFPLRERSAYQPEAPILDAEAIAAFDSPDLQARLVRSARVMADFYGFLMTHGDASWRLEPGPRFNERRVVWLNPGNHNFLRLTRIMRSLATLGLATLSQAWLDALTEVYAEHSATIGANTMEYWRSAASAAG
jgi:hypothetical protein